MSLTASELKRIQDLETNVKALTKLIAGAGSLNQLNRLLVLGQKTNSELTEKVEALETEMQELLELARKLQ